METFGNFLKKCPTLITIFSYVAYIFRAQNSGKREISISGFFYYAQIFDSFSITFLAAFFRKVDQKASPTPPGLPLWPIAAAAAARTISRYKGGVKLFEIF